ncbi:MAG: polysaccharide deacetylase family protein [Bacteroidaceae bacterium]|nr:polysaccharide deacetylase family protein [Bacteroidaceae bacterium]
MIIEQPSIYLRWLYPKAIWRMDRRQKAVYLTFDDGPIPEATPFILDVLDQFGIKATFFMVGDNARKYPHLLEEVRRRGHRIGNHTFNHIGGFRWLSKRYLQNTDKANELLHTDLFRPPHGWMRAAQYWRLQAHYRIIMWDLVTRDYSKWMMPEDIVNNVKRYARNGSIITFHDSLKSIEKLKSALPASLQWLRDQGYEFRIFD